MIGGAPRGRLPRFGLQREAEEPWVVPREARMLRRLRHGERLEDGGRRQVGEGGGGEERERGRNLTLGGGLGANQTVLRQGHGIQRGGRHG